MKDGQPTRDLMTVTHHVTTIGSAPCVAVDDRVFAAGKLAERTTDWYTQDSTGNVWYYGERTAELDRRGRVTSTEGSCQTGVHGARPGIFMPAQPHKGQSFRQELRLYVRGVGTVVEQTERGGSERNELVSFTVP
jgi:hypothetical protein